MIRDVLLEVGNVFLRGFRRLGPVEKLIEFVEIYKAFEHNPPISHYAGRAIP